MATTKYEYNNILVEAARRVLLEISRLLYDYKDGIVVVGGSVPGLIFDQSISEHVRTIDVDIALDHFQLQEVGYRTILHLLTKKGYIQGKQPFIFFRKLEIDGQIIAVEVDFLSGEYGGTGKKHRTQRVQDLNPRKARGCDLAFKDPIMVSLEGTLPEGAKDKSVIKVASVVSFLMMKAQALNSRLKEKDAYDIYYCLTNYPGGMDKLVKAFNSFPTHSLIREGLLILADKFSTINAVGPVFVANFLDETDADARDFILRDSYERVQYLVSHLPS